MHTDMHTLVYKHNTNVRQAACYKFNITVTIQVNEVTLH